MSKDVKKAVLGLVVATLGAALGCGGNNQDMPGTSSPSRGASSSMSSPVTTATDSTTPGPMPGANGSSSVSQDAGALMPAAVNASTPTPPPLTDPQIATIVATANRGELTQAQDAMKKAKNPKIVGFARHMVTDHGQAGKDLGDIQKSGKMDPSPTDMSRQIESDGKSVSATLQSAAAGADFERQYMDAQVTEHQQLLDALDTKLISGAQNADLKTFLQKVREKVAGHLQMAKDIRSQLK